MEVILVMVMTMKVIMMMIPVVTLLFFLVSKHANLINSLYIK